MRTSAVPAISRPTRLLQNLRLLRYRLFYGLLLNHQFKLLTLGNERLGCCWTFCPEGLNANSIVYSGGVGGDISFEQDLVDRFGCSIMLLDPSPTGRGTMARPENQRPQFKYLPLALSSRSGQLKLASPINREGDWWLGQDESGQSIEVECKDLETLMAENGHDHIDLLKLDIEGSEYAVIEHWLERRLRIRQICVEFHHGILPGFRRSQTIRLLFKLMARGYRLIHHLGGNHTLILASHRS